MRTKPSTPTLHLVAGMAMQSNNPMFKAVVEANRGRAQISIGINRLALNAGIDEAIKCLEQKLAEMRASLPPQQQRETS